MDKAGMVCGYDEKLMREFNRRCITRRVMRHIMRDHYVWFLSINSTGLGLR